MSTTSEPKKDWDGAEYAARPGMAEMARINGQENIPTGLLASGIPRDTFKNLDVLEIGAGPGTVTPYLAEQFRSVFALEPSEGMVPALSAAVDKYDNVTFAKVMLDESSAEAFAKGTPLESPTPEEPGRTVKAPRALYDVAVCTLVVHHVEEFAPFFQGIKSILKPGGVFVALEFTFAPDGTDLSRKYHLEKAGDMEPVSDDSAPLTKPNEFRTSYTVESLGKLFTENGFAGVGGVSGTPVAAFGAGKDGPRGVPTIAVFGRRPE